MIKETPVVTDLGLNFELNFDLFWILVNTEIEPKFDLQLCTEFRLNFD